jgi:hypothetical protein
MRCVERRAKNEELPILGRRREWGATVYEYREELDKWWRAGAKV